MRAGRPAAIRAAVVESPATAASLQTLPIPVPAEGELLIKVVACGVCNTDLGLIDGIYAATSFPLIPGHEIVGHVVAHGPNTDGPPVGTRVGQPFLYSACGQCEYCAKGDGIFCASGQMTGYSVPGGYREYMLVRPDFVVPVPAGLSPPTAATLLCAGLTAFTGLRKGNCRPGLRVAVLGLGGLGQYATAFAAAMGADVAVVSGSAEKQELAARLGARHFIDRNESDYVGKLQDWGWAQLTVSTAPSDEIIAQARHWTAPQGTVVMLGSKSQTMTVDVFDLIVRGITMLGTPSGSQKDARDLFDFVSRVKEMPPTVPVPFEDVQSALDQTRSGASARHVLMMQPDWDETLANQPGAGGTQ
jgi:D-arabinose 1-dehydrogenase-like Zn-dependent alcohol dehydrogenase